MSTELWMNIKADFTSRLQLVLYGNFHVEAINFKFKCEQAHKTM
jgi:hypothetical protein